MVEKLMKKPETKIIIIIINLFITYLLIIFPFPFSKLSNSYLYNSIGYHYYHNIVMPEFYFYKCEQLWSMDRCMGQEKFSPWEVKNEINEFGGNWKINEFIKRKDTYPFIDIDTDALRVINESIKDSGSKHYYIIVSSAGSGDEGRKITNFAVIIFFILMNYLIYKIETVIIKKLRIKNTI